MNWTITLKKGIIAFLMGLAATVVFAIIQAVSNYNPVVCSDTVTVDCSPKFIVAAYMSIIPIIVGGLTGIGNWLKSRNK